MVTSNSLVNEVLSRHRIKRAWECSSVSVVATSIKESLTVVSTSTRLDTLAVTHIIFDEDASLAFGHLFNLLSDFVDTVVIEVLVLQLKQLVLKVSLGGVVVADEEGSEVGLVKLDKPLHEGTGGK